VTRARLSHVLNAATKLVGFFLFFPSFLLFSSHFFVLVIAPVIIELKMSLGLQYMTKDVNDSWKIEILITDGGREKQEPPSSPFDKKKDKAKKKKKGGSGVEVNRHSSSSSSSSESPSGMRTVMVKNKKREQHIKNMFQYEWELTLLFDVVGIAPFAFPLDCLEPGTIISPPQTSLVSDPEAPIGCLPSFSFSSLSPTIKSKTKNRLRLSLRKITVAVTDLMYHEVSPLLLFPSFPNFSHLSPLSASRIYTSPRLLQLKKKS